MTAAQAAKKSKAGMKKLLRDWCVASASKRDGHVLYFPSGYAAKRCSGLLARFRLMRGTEYTPRGWIVKVSGRGRPLGETPGPAFYKTKRAMKKRNIRAVCMEATSRVYRNGRPIRVFSNAAHAKNCAALLRTITGKPAGFKLAREGWVVITGRSDDRPLGTYSKRRNRRK